MRKRLLSILLTLSISLSIMGTAAAANYTRTSVVSRTDGTWLFPLPSYCYNVFTDWAGCRGYLSCGICGTTHIRSWGDDCHGEAGYGHNGIDVYATQGTSVYAAAAGTVKYICNSADNARGKYIIIEHEITGTGYSYYSYYQHLYSISVKAGTTVAAGTIIGKSGNTGTGGSGGYGYHLHFGIVMAASGINIGNELYTIESCGWVTGTGYREGRIVNNPSVTSQFPTGKSIVLAPLAAHSGSVNYTFDASAVEIGSDKGTGSPTGSVSTISGHNAPTSLKAGQSYSIKGTISSTTKITSVTVGVYTSQSGGTMKTGRSVAPNRTSYNLSGLDRYVLFNKLSAGTYYYRVTATNSAGTTTLINQKFTVTPAYTYAKISNANAPSTLKAGQSYNLKGKITSGTKITSVTAGVYTSSSGTNRLTGKTVFPNSTSYNLTSIDRYVLFNKLSAGTYYYRVTATNSAGTATLINQKFTVSPAASANTYAKISDANAPSALKPGQSYNLKGKISSDTKLTNVTAGVYSSDSGTGMLTGKSVSPNTTSYNLTSIDRYVLFNKLSAGTYYYRVTATNSAGTAVLVNHKFTVDSKLPTTWFMLAPKCAPQSRMDVCGGGTESRVNVQLYQSNGTNAQYWYLHDLGNGYYALSSCVSGKYLDVDISNRTSSSDANVWQYQWNGSNAQQWKLIDAGGGYYYLASRLLPDFYLDVSGAGTANGTNIQVYKRNYTDAQKWMFC